MALDDDDNKSDSDSADIQKDYEYQRKICGKHFEKWNECQQVEFVEYLLSKMCHYQHGHINSYLKPMLQRDFITALPGKYTVLNLFALPLSEDFSSFTHPKTQD